MINTSAAILPEIYLQKGKGGIPVSEYFAGFAYWVKKLFASNEVGFAYDPNDLSTMFQDAAGTVPVTAVGQLVGLVLDKSKGLTLGAELFNDSTVQLFGATRLSPSIYRINAPDSTSVNFNIPIQGLRYNWVRIDFEVVRQGSGTARIDYNSGLSYVIPNSVGRHSIIAYCDRADNSIVFIRNTTPTDIDIKINSIKFLAGNHAYQTTSASRPLLGRHPVSGARNLMPHSNNPNDTSWVFIGGSRTANQLDSKGGYTAARFQGPSASNTNKQARAIKGGAYTYTVCLKAGSQHTARTNLLLRNAATAVNFQAGVIDLATGVITGAGWSSKPKPNGFWECTFTQHTGISTGDLLLCYFGATDVTTSAFDIIVDYMQLEAGEVSTPFQETTSLFDITEDGVPSTYYLAFDGSDDFLVTNSINFTATDKISLFAGVRKLSDAATGLVFELSANSETTRYSFALFAPSAAGTNSYNFRSFGSSGNAAGTPITTAYPAPHSAVLTASAKISTSLCRLSINRASPLLALESQGTGNYGNYPLYIGRRGGTTLPFNGHIYSLIGVGRLTTDAETAAIEKVLAKRTGVTLNV